MMKKRVNKRNTIKENIKSTSNKLKKNIKSKNYKGKINKNKRKILNVVLVLVIIFILLVISFFAYIVINAPEFNPNNLKFTQMTEVYDEDGKLITKMGNENRTEISYDDLPEVLIDAIIATEDSKFFQHNGFDLPRFVKASIGQALKRNSGGASTLTMQIVKNNYTSTESEGIDGIVRKFTDIYLSIFKVERKYTKKEIIELYINDAYLGNNAYGVEQASRNYFGKSVGELNLSEASFIAGLFQSPANYNPYNYPEKAEKRRQTVLYLMKRHGYITEKERQIALAEPINHYIVETQASSTNMEYQGYIDTVVEELKNEYDLNPYTTPLKIYTAMKRSKQDFINEAMKGNTWKWENEKAQTGIVMSNSKTGEVLAVGAGRNKTGELSFNFATQSNRQIGSTAKPIFAYGPAIEYLGWGTTNYIVDEPVSYTNGKSVKNAEGGYKGILPMYQALGLSRNTTALKTFQQVAREAGNEKIVKFATNLGLTPEIESGRIHEAHSIGAFTGSTKKGESRNSPMTMAGAYAAFSNGGYYIKPHAIKKIVYKETDEVIEANFPKTRVMNDSTAYIITYALNWGATQGGAKAAANISGVDIAAKTGTTNLSPETLAKYGITSGNHINDLWVCGYTPSQVVTFWYGYDQIYKNYYNTTRSWATRDGFYKFLAEGLFDKNGERFSVPSSIVQADVIKNSMPLRLATANTPEYMRVKSFFRKGTEPAAGEDSSFTLPSVTNVTSKVSDKKVTLHWSGISPEDLLNYNIGDNYGDLGYDIYVKDGISGAKTYLGTTTSTSYTHTTNYENPIYIIYTAFKNYKENKSNGVEHKVTMQTATDFDIVLEDDTITQGDAFTDKMPIAVFYNSINVTSESNIVLTSGTVDSSTPGQYKLTYKVTYNGSSKTVSRMVTVKAKTTTSTSTDVE